MDDNSTFVVAKVPQNSVSEYAMFLLSIGELIGHLLLECPFSALNLHLIWTTSVLHQNLKFILICQSLCIFARGAIRTLVQCLNLLNVNFGQIGQEILLGIFIFPMNLRNHIPHIMIIERFMATIFAKDYEKWRNPCFTICWLGVTVDNLLIIFLSAFDAVQVTKNRHSIGFSIISNGTLLILCAVETVAFFRLYLNNLKKYRHKFEDNKQQQKLSERYQLAENIRTTKQLAPTLLLHLANLSIVTGGTLLYYFGFADTKFSYFSSLTMQFQITLITYTNFMVELTILINHPFLQHKLHRMCQKYVKSCVRRSNRVVEEKGGIAAENDCQWQQQNAADQRRKQSQQKVAAIGLTDMNGRAMELSQDQEAYFNRLRKYWE